MKKFGAPTDLHYFKLYSVLILVAIIFMLFGHLARETHKQSVCQTSVDGVLGTHVRSAQPTRLGHALICQINKQTNFILFFFV